MEYTINRAQSATYRPPHYQQPAAHVEANRLITSPLRGNIVSG